MGRHTLPEPPDEDELFGVLSPSEKVVAYFIVIFFALFGFFAITMKVIWWVSG